MASVRPSIQIKPELSLLVSLAHQTQFYEHGALPDELYRPESIACAISIGEGSTFSVSRQKVPALPPVEMKAEMDGGSWTVSKASTRKELPDWIVYKVAQVEFSDDGLAVPDHRHRLAAALVELLVLTHQPVMDHPYLPALFGFAWGQNRYLSQQRIPVAIVDWANCGSLDSYQSLGNVISDKAKKKLAWEVGVALDFLHACEIYHGDVKSENVLLNQDRDGNLRAKLTDFGMSVVSDHGYLKYLPPGTLQWAAPEIRWTPRDSTDLAKADTFSYGLLVWRMFCDGGDPLHKLYIRSRLPALLKDEQVSNLQPLLCRPDPDELRRMFEEGTVLKCAVFFEWRTMIRMIRSISEQRTTWTEIRRWYKDRGFLSYEPGEGYAAELAMGLSWLALVFENTLQNSPQARDLSSCLSALEEEEDYTRPSVRPCSVAQSKPRILESATTNSMPTSWLAMRSLEPKTLSLIMSHRLKRAERKTLSPRVLQGLLHGNAACYIGGMGSDRYFDIDKALHLLLTAARKGSRDAAALIYRMHSTFDKDIPDDVDHVEKVFESAYFGSVAAFEDLRILADLWHWGRHLFDDQCLNGWSFADRQQLGWIDEVLKTATGHPELVRVNRRGDTLLHAAVTLKLPVLLTQLLDQLGFDVNITNHEEETPLLCAVRAASVPMALLLLDRGANPCITSRSGESPMHWVLSATDLGYQGLINKLISKGGWQTITCWARLPQYAAIKISSFRHYSERLCDGTPLHWAICRKKAYLVRLLVEKGAPMDFSGPRNQFTALQVAAHLHEAEMLRYLIDKQADLNIQRAVAQNEKRAQTDQPAVATRRVPIWGGQNLIRAAIEGADRYNLAHRHGPAHKTFLRRTFRLLAKEFNRVTYMGVDGQGRTALYYAVRTGYDIAVEMILDYMKGAEEINKPYGNEAWTPICEAIRRDHESLFDLLVSRGARVTIKIDTPAQKSKDSPPWGLLHLAARSSEGSRTGIAQRLLELGLPTDEYGLPDDYVESPLSLAVENDAFPLADLLRRYGADINATSRHLYGGAVLLTEPVSILGRVIASNMRYSKYRLQYLLYLDHPATTLAASRPEAEFLIFPSNNMSALHWSLLFHRFLPPDHHIDNPTRLEIFRILLDRYDSPEEVNAQRSTGETVLHLAVRTLSVPIVRLLVDDPGPALASLDLPDNQGAVPLAAAKAVESQIVAGVEVLEGLPHDQALERVGEIVAILEDAVAAKEEDETDDYCG